MRHFFVSALALGADAQMSRMWNDLEASMNQHCKGKNCGCTDGRSHSPECRAEYEAVIGQEQPAPEPCQETAAHKGKLHAMSCGGGVNGTHS